MSKLPQPVVHLTTRELHGEIRSWMQRIRQDSTVLDDRVYHRLEALVDEIGYRNNRLATADKDKQRKLNWWRTLSVAIVAFAFCIIAVLLNLLLAKGA
jgi:hypothetical protein